MSDLIPQVKYKIALVLNPWAGIGGSLALKGSDGNFLRDEARSKGGKPRVLERVERFLNVLNGLEHQIEFISFPSAMGEELLKKSPFQFRVLHPEWAEAWLYDETLSLPFSSAEDTHGAVRASLKEEIDLLIFAGGDGTARDVAEVLKDAPSQVCLGIPCGVKIHSSVYAKTPEFAAALVREFVESGHVSVVEAEVKDIDETALREGRVNSKHYASLLVPMTESEGLSLQATKEGGSQNEQSELLVHEEIAAYLSQELQDLEEEPILIVGAGKTTQAFKRQLGEEGSLLGVDIFYGGQVIQQDANELQIMNVLDTYPERGVNIVVSLIGGQGCIFGRGNQQLSSSVIKEVMRRNQSEDDHGIKVLATNAKLAGLKDAALFVDTGDVELDKRLSGSRLLITHFDEQKLCRVIA